MHKLILHENMTLREGPVMKGGKIFRYEVLGLPPGRGAMIHNDGTEHDPHWHIIRIKEDHWEPPTGDYKTAEEALSVLEKEVP
jgi:hypothetical protein